MTGNEREQDIHRYLVVANDEAQYSIWLADRDLPGGWREAGPAGTKDECLKYIEQVWVDMRPLSLREQMDGGPVSAE